MSQLTEQKYRELKQEVEKAAVEAERAKGALSQLVEQLKEEFDCSSLKEAQALLTDLEEKKEAAEKEFERELRIYEKKWKEIDGPSRGTKDD